MPINNDLHDGDFKAFFQERLVAAVESYAAAHAENPAWFYKQVSLAPSLARDLYANALKDPGLQQLCQRQWQRQMAGEQSPQAAEAREIAFDNPHVLAVARIINDSGTHLLLRVPLMVQIKRWLRLHGLIACGLGAAILHFLRRRLRSLPPCDVLSNPRGGKHRRHLQPLVARSNLQFRLFDDREWPPVRLADLWRLRAYSTMLGIGLSAIKYEAAIRYFRPRAVLTVEGDSVQDCLLAQTAQAFGVYAVCLHWGAPITPFVKIGYRNFQGDEFLSWGEYFTEIFREFSPRLKFRNVGNHKLEPQTAAAGDRRKVVLLHQKDAYFFDPASLRACMDFFLAAAAQFPEWEFVIRPHPNEPLPEADLERLQAIPNLRLDDSRKVSLAKTMEGALLSVSMNTTAALEAMCSGVIPFFFNPSGLVPDYQRRLAELGCGCLVEDVQAALPSFAEWLNDPALQTRARENIEKNRRFFFERTGEAALDAIVKALRAAVGEGSWPD